ncbi:hypothetical protein C8R45DRAFT_1094806 [Mycena sanguinolenta]|nr:hypothetical protein C8R45DRAFT_1094806 [Mycena sanguinolenta]
MRQRNRSTVRLRYRAYASTRHSTAAPPPPHDRSPPHLIDREPLSYTCPARRLVRMPFLTIAISRFSFSFFIASLLIQRIFVPAITRRAALKTVAMRRNLFLEDNDEVRECHLPLALFPSLSLPSLFPLSFSFCIDISEP